MATTKAFELAQLSALTAVDASGNVTTNTSQIANASGDLTLDSAADIILNADGADIILKDDTVDFGRFKQDDGNLVIKSDTIDKSVIIKGTTTSNATVTALTFDMANGGRATFNEQIIAQSNITTNRLNIINGTAPYIEFTEGTDVVHMGVDNGSFWIRQGGLAGGDELTINSSGELQVNHDATFAGIIDVTNNTASTSSTTGALVVAGGAGITENLYVGGNTVISGDLTVEGTSVTLNTTDLNVEDKNITLNYHASNDTSASAGGAGITIQDAVSSGNDASILWDQSNSEFDISHSMKIAGSVGVTNIVTNKVVKFNGTILDDSNITDDGTTITASSDFNTSGQMTFTTNSKAIRMRDSNGLYTRSMILNASDVFYIGPVDAYAGGAILYGASADVTDQQFYTGGTLRYTTKSTGDFQWYEDNDSANGGTPAVGMHWDYANGRLGIGTLTPETNLDVSVDSNLAYTSGMGGVSSYTPTASDIIQVRNTETGVDDIYAGIWFETGTGATNTTGTDRSGRIALVVDNDNSYSSNFVFQTRGSGASLTEKMRITQGGTVGIGTSSPNTDALLHVSSGTSGNAIVIIESDTDNNNENDNPQLQFKQDNGVTIAKVGLTGDAGQIFTDSLSNAAYLGNDESASVQLYTNAIARLTIESGGDVGIGTNVPDCALDVTRTTGWAEMHLDGASGGDLIFKDNGVSYGEVYAGNGHGLVVKSYSGQDIYFLTDNNATPKMVIESGGNVGIGVDPAVHKLDVDGAIATRQVRHSLRPSLNLDFTNSKQLDPRIAFYRSSGATYYDNRGIVRYATENEPRFDHDPYTGESKGLLFEEARTNTKTYSEHLPTTMGTEFGASWVPNYAVAPNGKMQAAALYSDGNTSARAVQSYTGANTYTMSIYAKNNASNNTGRFAVWAYSGGWVYAVTFTWDGDTVTHNAPAGSTRVEKIGNGWVRVYCTWSTSGNGSFQVSPGAYANYNAGDSTLFWGMNFEAGKAFSGSYISSDTRFVSRASEATYHDETGIIRTAPANYSRYGYKYDGRKWVETGLILEGSATNKVHQDSIPSAAYQSTNTYGYYSPDGSYKAFQNVPNSGTSPGGAACVIWSNTGFDNTTSKHTISIYAKGVSGFDRVRLHDNNNNKHVVFNLTGLGSFDTATNIDAAHIQFVGDGWYRIGMTYTPQTNTSPYFQMYSMETGNGSGGFRFFGAQTELGDKMTSFIYTTTGNVTRSADISTSITTVRERDYAIGHDVDKLLPDVNASDIDFTLYGDIQGIAHNGGFQQAIYLEDTSDAGNMYVALFSAYNGNSTISSSYNINSTSRNFGNWTSTASDIALRWKIAMGVDENDSRAAANGSLGSSAAGYWNGGGTFDRFYLGNGYQGGRYFNGWIRKIGYYDKRLSNDELVALTENN